MSAQILVTEVRSQMEDLTDFETLARLLVRLFQNGIWLTDLTFFFLSVGGRVSVTRDNAR